jgi:hypothetical protein
MSCDAISGKFTLLVYGELDEAERGSIDAHLASCGACRVALAEERRLHAVLAVREPAEPGDDLLAACRDDLAAALRRAADPAAAGSTRPLASRSGGWRGVWLRAQPSPALAAALLVIGFLAGWLVMGRGVTPQGRPSLQAGADTMTTDLHSVQLDPGGERVNLTYDTRTRRSLRGRVEDPAIRRLLADTVRDSSNAGLRLDAIGLLEGQAADAEVRRALVQALRDDRNAGARLKALAALDPQASSDPEVRDAMTDALLRDDNLGVRVRAIDALARTGDPQLAPLMRRLASDDSEPYIRLRSGAIAEEMYARVKR